MRYLLNTGIVEFINEKTLEHKNMEFAMKELKFIHITKCAGTSIENLGKKYGYNWGKYHYEEYGWWHQNFQTKVKN